MIAVPVKPNMICPDCGVRCPALYMVTKEIWNTYGNGKGPPLCVRCLQNRMPRKLTLEDFIVCKLNDVVNLLKENEEVKL